MQIPKRERFVFALLFVLTLAFGLLSHFAIKGFADCRFTDVVDFDRPCADQIRLMVSDSLLYLGFISGVLLIVMPIMFVRRDVKDSLLKTIPKV